MFCLFIRGRTLQGINVYLRPVNLSANTHIHVPRLKNSKMETCMPFILFQHAPLHWRQLWTFHYQAETCLMFFFFCHRNIRIFLLYCWSLEETVGASQKSEVRSELLNIQDIANKGNEPEYGITLGGAIQKSQISVLCNLKVWIMWHDEASKTKTSIWVLQNFLFLSFLFSVPTRV